MSGTEDLAAISRSGELRISSKRADGTRTKPVIIWSAEVDGDVYVRSVNGVTAPWYRGTRPTHEGRVQAAGREADVRFVDVDASDAVNDRLDAAYADKYGAGSNSVKSINSTTAREATIKVVPV